MMGEVSAGRQVLEGAPLAPTLVARPSAAANHSICDVRRTPAPPGRDGICVGQGSLHEKFEARQPECRA